MELCLSSAPHEWRAKYRGNNHSGMFHGCPTITVHAGKWYRALIDSGAAISLLWYSTYQNIDHSFKTPMQPTTAKLNTVDGSLMTALGMTALHLWIADFKFTHNFMICYRLPDTEIIFGIDIQKKFSISYAWDKAKNCYIQKDGKFLTYMGNCDQKVTIGIVKLTLRYHQDRMVSYQLRSQDKHLRNIWLTFITDGDSTKGKTLTSTLYMVYMTSKEKHLLMF